MKLKVEIGKMIDLHYRHEHYYFYISICGETWDKQVYFHWNKMDMGFKYEQITEF